MKSPLFFITFSFLMFFTLLENVNAKAFCALRDPVNAIKFLFPESKNYRSIVKAINADMRDEISELLPFTLHFNELGKHTLYVANRQNTDLGFVHARSELTQWGLIEIAWAFNPDLSIRNLKFQRCRIPKCENKHLNNILNLILGKHYSDLLKMIDKSGDSLTEEIKNQYPESEALILAAIKSALKTIIVTSIAWQDEISEINRDLILSEMFDDQNYSIQTFKINQSKFHQLEKQMGGGGSMIYHDSTQAFRVHDENNQTIANLIKARWRSGDFVGMFHWLFSPDGKVLSIRPIPNWPNEEVSHSFDGLLGTYVNNIEDCGSAAELIAYELYFLSK